MQNFLKALGIIPFYKKGKRFFQLIGIVSGIVSRVIIMSISNILVVPFFQILPLEAIINILPFISIFNIVAGAISAFLGYILYEILRKRIGL